MTVINDSNELLISLSISAHVGVGGHASVAFNISELFTRLFDR